jgi:hypothetical protein
MKTFAEIFNLNLLDELLEVHKEYYEVCEKEVEEFSSDISEEWFFCEERVSFKNRIEDIVFKYPKEDVLNLYALYYFELELHTNSCFFDMYERSHSLEQAYYKFRGTQYLRLKESFARTKENFDKHHMEKCLERKI